MTEQATTYRIKDWDAVFENNRSRQLEQPGYVNWPVKRRSEAFALLMLEADGLAAFAVFALAVQYAAGCPQRGVLRDDKGPLTADRLAVRFGANLESVRRVWPLLAKVGWFVILEASEVEDWVRQYDARSALKDTPSSDRTLPDSTSDGQVTADRQSGVTGTSVGDGRVRHAGARVQSPTLLSSPLESGCTLFQAELEKVLLEVLGRDLRTNERREVVVWCMAVEAMPPAEVGGTAKPQTELALESAKAAQKQGVNGSVKGFLAYAESIRDRCTRQRCNVGEVREAARPNLKPVRDKKSWGDA